MAIGEIGDLKNISSGVDHSQAKRVVNAEL